MSFADLISDIRERRQKIVRIAYDCGPRASNPPEAEITLDDGTRHTFSLRAANALYAAQVQTDSLSTYSTAQSNELTFEQLRKALS